MDEANNPENGIKKITQKKTTKKNELSEQKYSRFSDLKKSTKRALMANEDNRVSPNTH